MCDFKVSNFKKKKFSGNNAKMTNSHKDFKNCFMK